MKTKSTLLLGVALCGLNVSTPPAFSQGALLPPGLPAPMMKTLDQIEPRRPISALPYNITAPGSYYVTTNLTGTPGQNGIIVNASDVTIDLMGFTLTGVSGSEGIAVLSGKNLSIRNGTLRSWAIGIESDSSNNQFERLRLSDNSVRGLLIGPGSTVKDCVAERNGGPGFVLRDGCLVIGCVARTNGSVGIQAGNGVIIKDCVSETNSFTGMQLGDNCVVSGCVSAYNGYTGVQTVGSGGTVTGCTISGNAAGGIFAVANSFIANNNVISNINAACIRLGGSGNRIEGNNLAGKTFGILTDSTNNLIIRNSARGSAGDYSSIGPGNTVGPIVTSANIATNSNPHSNYQY